MPVLTDRDKALEQLKTLSEADTEPRLTSGTENAELDLILDRWKRASIWEASTSYPFGAVVIPTASKRNGHRYKIIAFDGTGTTSGATEPGWSTTEEATVSDNNITWQEDGADYDVLWDLRSAAYEAWRLKASKVAGRFDFKTPTHEAKASQLKQHCLDMAEEFKDPTLV